MKINEQLIAICIFYELLTREAPDVTEMSTFIYLHEKPQTSDI